MQIKTVSLKYPRIAITFIKLISNGNVGVCREDRNMVLAAKFKKRKL